MVCLSMLIMYGCNSAFRIKDAYQLSKCEYNYKDVSQLKVANVDLNQGLTLTALGQLATLFTAQQKTLPMEMVVNVKVDNPTTERAALSKMAYKIAIDGQHIADGASVEPFTVDAGQSGTLPLLVKFDAATLFTGKTGTAAINVLKNIMGIGSTPSKITLQLKPYFMMGQKEVAMPGYYPVSLNIGEKK